MAQLIGAYGEPQDTDDWDISRLAFEYRNTSDRGALDLIVSELSARDDQFQAMRTELELLRRVAAGEVGVMADWLDEHGEPAAAAKLLGAFPVGP